MTHPRQSYPCCRGCGKPTRRATRARLCWSCTQRKMLHSRRIIARLEATR